MGLFKRITATLAANVESAVGAMENHDAVVEASLSDLRRASARTKARLNRVAADGTALKRKLTELKESHARWQERARQHASGDEEKALECLQRRKACQAQIAACLEAIAQHDDLETRLRKAVEKIDQRYRDLDRTRTLMRTRQSAAQAIQSTESAYGANHCMHIDDTLERWEAKINEAEVDCVDEPNPSQFEQAFIDDEERAALQAELDELKSSQ